MRAVLPAMCAVLWACGSGNPQLSVSVQGGHGEVVISYFQTGTDCPFCPVPGWNQFVDCTDTGHPMCSGRAPDASMLQMKVTPASGFRFGTSDCPATMPSMDSACTVQLLDCSTVCPTCTAPPAIDPSVVPTSVCIGSLAHLTGTNLGGNDTCVVVNGISSNDVVANGTSLAFFVESNTPEGSMVTIQTSRGTVATTLVSVITMPSQTSLSPSSGMPGAMVTLTGSDLMGATVNMDPNSGAPPVAATVVSSTPSQVVFTVPAGTAAGQYTIASANACGSDIGVPLAFTVN